VTATDEPAHPFTRALIDAHAATLDASNAAATERLVGLFERFESDMAPALAPILAHVVDHPDTPEPIRDLLRLVSSPEHFGESVLIGIALGSVLSPVLGAATAPFIQAIANTVWPEHSNVPLSPQELAAAVLKGVLTEPQAANLAALSGVNAANFHNLYEIAGNAPGIMEALSLLRRGDIDEHEFERIVHYSNIRSDFLADLLKLQYLPPGIGEVIAGRLKGHLTEAEYVSKLNDVGIREDNAEWLRLTAGRPIGIEQALHLWNRGYYTEADVDETVRQSDMNDHWLDAVKQLRVYVPPVRSIMPQLRSGSIDDAKATALFKENGVRDEDIPGYLAEAHHARTQTAKEITQAQVLRMYRAQFIDRPAALAKLETLRYDTATANLLLDFTDEARAEALMDATARKVGTRYVAHKMTKTDASNALNAAGVPALAQHQLFQFWDIERDANVLLPSPAAVLGAFRRGDIDAASAHERLVGSGVQVDDMHIFVADAFAPTKPNPEAVHAVVNNVAGYFVPGSDKLQGGT